MKNIKVKCLAKTGVFVFFLSVIISPFLFLNTYAKPTDLQPCPYFNKNVDRLVVNGRDITDYYLNLNNWYFPVTDMSGDKLQPFFNYYQTNVYPKIKTGEYKYLTVKYKHAELYDYFFIFIDTKPNLPFKDNKAFIFKDFKMFGWHNGSYIKANSSFPNPKERYIVLHSQIVDDNNMIYFYDLRTTSNVTYDSNIEILSSSTMKSDFFDNKKCKLTYLLKNTNQKQDNNKDNSKLLLQLTSFLIATFISYLIIKAFTFKGRI